MLYQEFPSEGIYIKSVYARNCGPVVNKKLELAPFTLIYSPNEGGKTYLLEGIIYSLFGKVRGIVKRECSGCVKVILCVDGEGKTSDAVSIDRHLLDFMVIRGGVGDVSVSRMEEIVYGDALCKLEDYIRRKAGIGKRTLENEISDIKRLLKRLNEIGEELFVSGRFSKELFSCDKNLKNLIDRLDEIKRKQGNILYLIKKELREIEQRLLLFTEVSLRQIAIDIANYRRLMDERTQLSDTLDDIDKEFERLEIYNLWKDSHRYVMYFSFALTGMGIVFAALYSGLLGSIISAFGAVLSILLSGRTKEYNMMVKDYEDMYGEAFSTIGLHDEKELKVKKTRLLDRKKDLEYEMEKLKEDIHTKFARFGIESAEESLWDKYLYTLEKEEEKNRKRKIEMEMVVSEMERRGVKAVNMASDNGHGDILSAYSLIKEERERIESQIESLREEKEQLERRILYLKSELKGIIGEEIEGMDIKRLREYYYDFVEAKEGELKEKEARLFVREKFLELIDDYRKRGRSDVEAVLGKALPLLEEVGGYEAINLSGENVRNRDKKIVLKKDGEEYSIDELSTGMVEQLYIAIRFAILEGRAKKKMFVLLDDAFQYSDWDRRMALVKEARRFSDSGWQVIYFTMDQHIRRLFEGQGARVINLI